LWAKERSRSHSGEGGWGGGEEGGDRLALIFTRIRYQMIKSRIEINREGLGGWRVRSGEILNGVFCS
jgi:hypothetical protein